MAMNIPNYLSGRYQGGDHVRFQEFGYPQAKNFYNIDPATFPFWKMRNQLDAPGIYTPGRPKYTPYQNVHQESPAGIFMPSGRNLYPISDATGWPQDPLSQEGLANSYLTQSFPRKMPDASNFEGRPGAYNRAMRRYATAAANYGIPMIAYYHPRFSAPRRVSAQTGGLLGV